MQNKVKTGIIIVICLIVAVCIAFGAYLIIEKINYEKDLEDHPVYYKELIKKYADEFDLDPYLVISIIRCESSFDQYALSEKGAIGLMQVMPDTGTWIAHKLGLDSTYQQDQLYDPETNIRFGCWYLSFLNGRFSGYRDAMICAFNAGHGNVRNWLDDPRYAVNGVLTSIPFPQTERYLDRVTTAFDHYCDLYPDLFVE